MKKIMLVMLLFVAFGVAQETVQDTVVIQAKIAELRTARDNIVKETNDTEYYELIMLSVC